MVWYIWQTYCTANLNLPEALLMQILDAIEVIREVKGHVKDNDDLMCKRCWTKESCITQQATVQITLLFLYQGQLHFCIAHQEAGTVRVQI